MFWFVSHISLLGFQDECVLASGTLSPIAAPDCLVYSLIILSNRVAVARLSSSTVSSVAVLFVGIVFYCVYQAVHAIRVANRKRRIRHLSARLYNQTMKIHYVE